MTLADLGARTHNRKMVDHDHDLYYHLGHLHAEVSEAWECVKEAEKATEAHPELLHNVLQETWLSKSGHPEGFGIELADVVIMAAHIAHLTGLDLDALVEQKTAYKEDRAMKRGLR